MEKVAVLILNYKVADLSLGCIESIKKSTYRNFKILVIDNCSGCSLSQDIKKMADVEFIQNKKNLGYTGGNNVGIKRALEENADFIFILNPDTTVDKDCIKFLVEGSKKFDTGITGPKIYFADGETIWYAGGVFDELNVIGKHLGVDQKDRGQYDQAKKVDYVSGAAMMVKKEVFLKIGLFDERYFLYYEDSDFCFRAKHADFKIFYFPKALVYHNNAKSAGLGSPIQDYFMTRNRILFASKFLPLRTRFALFREVLKNLNNPMRRLALFDFLIGNFGQGSCKI